MVKKNLFYRLYNQMFGDELNQKQAPEEEKNVENKKIEGEEEKEVYENQIQKKSKTEEIKKIILKEIEKMEKIQENEANSKEMKTQTEEIKKIILKEIEKMENMKMDEKLAESDQIIEEKQQQKQKQKMKPAKKQKICFYNRDYGYCEHGEKCKFFHGPKRNIFISKQNFFSVLSFYEKI